MLNLFVYNYFIFIVLSEKSSVFYYNKNIIINFLLKVNYNKNIMQFNHNAFKLFF